MKALVIVGAAALALALRLVLRRRRRPPPAPPASARLGTFAIPGLGEAGLVAGREVRERVRGGAFRVGTALILAVVTAAIVIPVVTKGSKTRENVGSVGPLPASQQHLVRALGTRSGLDVHFAPSPSVSAATAAVRAGRTALCLCGTTIVVEKAPSSNDSSGAATFVRDLSVELGVERAYRDAGLSAAQAGTLARARPLAVVGLKASHEKGAVAGTSIIGVILIFVMLTQYLTWTLMGVMEEKASRVVEVLLAALRPIQLLAGKVLGIGLVAMGQAAVILAFAFALAKVVGSNILHGSAPLELAAAGVWLVLGYAFYCWVYATAGSMIERQDQVQSLALPLSLPMLVGYITSITAAGTGSAGLFLKVLAYLPPTAPFAMPVLVGLSAVSWWQFAASALLSVAATVALARLAARVYQRAILRTGRRVKVRELWAGAGRA